MKRRTLTAGIAGLALAAVGRPVSAAVKSGTCGACRNHGDCQTGLICQGGVCGDANAACGGTFYQCGARRHLRCRPDGSAVCTSRRDGRRRTGAAHMCA